MPYGINLAAKGAAGAIVATLRMTRHLVATWSYVLLQDNVQPISRSNTTDRDRGTGTDRSTKPTSVAYGGLAAGMPVVLLADVDTITVTARY